MNRNEMLEKFNLTLTLFFRLFSLYVTFQMIHDYYSFSQYFSYDLTHQLAPDNFIAPDRRKLES